MAILDALKKNKDEKTKPTTAIGSGVEKKETVSTKKEVVSVSAKPSSAKGSGEAKKEVTLQNILKHPRITEKAAILAEKNVYTFEVDPHAGKIEIARAVKQVYNVEVVRVNIIKLPAKKVTIRGKRGVKSAVKKALVYLKEGDKIEFV